MFKKLLADFMAAWQSGDVSAGLRVVAKTLDAGADVVDMVIGPAAATKGVPKLADDCTAELASLSAAIGAGGPAQMATAAAGDAKAIDPAMWLMLAQMVFDLVQRLRNKQK